MILRRLARPLLSAIFIFGGIGALKQTEGHAQAAKPWLDKTVGKVGDAMPESVPTDPQTLVRIDAGVKLGAGTLLALGKCPRLSSMALLGSLVPTTLAAHAFWEIEDPGERQQQMTQFFKNASLAGGLIIASADTAGKPSLGWRAKHAGEKAGKQITEASESMYKHGGKLSRKARKALD